MYRTYRKNVEVEVFGTKTKKNLMWMSFYHTLTSIIFNHFHHKNKVRRNGSSLIKEITRWKTFKDKYKREMRRSHL